MKILIYRLGSLGDTVVALPALRLVAKTFPDAERWLLTNVAVSSKAVPVAQVLDGMGLIKGYLEYPVGLRDIRQLLVLRRRICELAPDILVYLAAPRGRIKAWRDAAFFLSCGVRRIFGLPLRREQQCPLKLSGGKYEYEGARLARCIASLGDARFDDPASFDLSLSEEEMTAAEHALAPVGRDSPMLIASIGAKVDVKDWGDDNWSVLLATLGVRLPGWALIMLGASDERERSAALLRQWPGKSLNLCGTLSVRQSAAVLERCNLYLGHDSGPMHLAAAVGTPCVALFSSRNLPGEWFPYGKQHRVIYHSIECQGCRLDVCVARNKACIRSITVDEVERAALDIAAHDIRSVVQRAVAP